MGRHGRRYIDHLREGIPGARLEAVTRRDFARGREEARLLGVRWIAGWRRVLDDPEIDAVAICVPCPWHPKMAVAALEAGKHVVLEKPLAPTLAQGREIERAVQRAGRKSGARLFFAHTLRYSEVVVAAERSVSRIGNPRHLNLTQRLEPKPMAWERLRRTAGGGVVLQTGVHMFDLARRLSGAEVKEVSALADRVVEAEIEDRFSALLELSDGSTASVEAAKYGRGRTGGIEWVGDRGILIGDHVHHRLSILDSRGEKPIRIGPAIMTVREVLKAATLAFREGSEPAITVRDGLASLAIAGACYRSARSGRRERVASV